MTNQDKEKYKDKFGKALNEFVKDLKTYVSTDTGEWTVKGFIDIYKNIYTISSDTKIVSKILEIHIFPEILQFAEKYGYKIILAEHQNWYPDLSIIDKDNEEAKFALDLKTTFRRNNKTAGFTLGSHGAYFKERNKSKNIQFPYNQYLGHYCLGIIYTREDFEDDLADTEIYQVQELQDEYGENQDPIKDRQVTNVANLKSITSVIKDFDFFAAEKWKIASDRRGSGNTANIGSINDIKDLKAGNGVFSKLGEEWFDEYWINYGTATMMKEGKTVKISSIWDFLEFKGRKDLYNKVVAKGAKRKRTDQE
ncbi:MAG: EcoRV family type II restriction endonuclease [Bacteroidetes bacterium]|nr:EcoRV family type II restriction endonuclease [Bacteroidota bacterium]